MTIRQHEITVLHPRRFDTEDQANAMAAEARATLKDLGLGSPGGRDEVISMFQEAAKNAATHAAGRNDPAVKAYALMKFSPEEGIFRFTVTDTGPGIRETLKSAGVESEGDADALAKAVGLHHDAAPKGGLSRIYQAALEPGYALTLSSIEGNITIGRESGPECSTGSRYPGTFIAVVIPAGPSQD